MMAVPPHVSPLPATLHISTPASLGAPTWHKGPGRKSLLLFVSVFFLVSYVLTRQMVSPNLPIIKRISIRKLVRVSGLEVRETPAQVPARKSGQSLVADAKHMREKKKDKEKLSLRPSFPNEDPLFQLNKSELRVTYSPRCEDGNRLCSRLSTECKYKALFDIMVSASARAKQTKVWQPQPGKYLLMHCRFGQMSNLLRCMRSSLIVAGYLNRTLLVPFLPEQFTFGYDLRPVWDMEHTRKCFGGGSVDTIHELYKRKGEDIRLGEVVCFGTATCPIANRSLPVAPQLPKYDHLVVDPDLKVKEVKLGNYPPSDVVSSKALYKTLRESKADVILGGEFFWLYFTDSRVLTEATLPFVRSPKCKSIMAIQPPPPVLAAGREFIKQNFGDRFLSVHLRRNADFLVDCFRFEMRDDRWPHCTHSIRQLARCVGRELDAKNMTKVFLATDAKGEELTAFITLLKRRQKGLQVLTLNDGDSTWATELVAQGFQLRPKLELATVERVIAASAEIFLGTAHSTFSMEIQRMRFSMKSAGWDDHYMCECEASEVKWDPDLQSQSDNFWKNFKL